MNLRLEAPETRHENRALEYRQEHFLNGEKRIHAGALLDKILLYDEWLKSLKEGVNPKWVPFSTFFAVREIDDRIVGMICVRHTINDSLREYGGHIGYGVRPTERGKGYATEMLSQALQYSRDVIGLDDVILTCSKENIGSQKVILKNGGVLEREFLYINSNGKTNGETVLSYSIALKSTAQQQKISAAG